MRITSKGQVTIPIGIREKAGLTPNTEVDFDFDGRYVRLRRAKLRKRPSQGEDLVRHLRDHHGDIAMTTDEIMALMRGV